jgi:hypothetical protein
MIRLRFKPGPPDARPGPRPWPHSSKAVRVRKRNLSNAIDRTMLDDARRLADGDMT